MKPPLVIYHAGCWDGFCAAWLLWKVFPDAAFHAAHYGADPPCCIDRDVFIVDFSYPRDVMLGILGDCRGRLVVLDHHKTAQAALEGLEAEWLERAMSVECGIPVIVFDMDKSGGRLTWDYCCQMHLTEMLGAFPHLRMPDAAHGLCPPPWLVNYTEDRDLWLWQLEESRAINAGLRSFPLDFATWDMLYAAGTKPLQADGTAILRREQQIIDEHVRHAREIEMDGHTILAVNATVLFSDIAGELAKDRPFGACYFDRKDGKRQWSLRSREDAIDVSEIAKNHGGGGHRNAAGFEE